MDQRPIRNVVVSPNGRERVELSGPQDGVYGFRIWRCKRKIWRKQQETYRFDSYACAVVEAAREIDWLGRALSPGTDWRITYHLELLRGYAFEFSAYSEQRFGSDHYHCSACWQKIAEYVAADVRHEGYFTRYSIPDNSGASPWNWVCDNCFQDLQAKMNWTVESPR
jgi:hypothetical protein